MSFWTCALFTVCPWCPGADFDTRRAHEVALSCLLFGIHGIAGTLSLSSFKQASVDSPVAACPVQFGIHFCPCCNLFCPCFLDHCVQLQANIVWSCSLVDYSGSSLNPFKSLECVRRICNLVVPIQSSERLKPFASVLSSNEFCETLSNISVFLWVSSRWRISMEIGNVFSWVAQLRSRFFLKLVDKLTAHGPQIFIGTFARDCLWLEMMVADCWEFSSSVSTGNSYGFFTNTTCIDFSCLFYDTWSLQFFWWHTWERKVTRPVMQVQWMH